MHQKLNFTRIYDMQENYQKLLSQLETPQAPLGLLNKIILKIDLESQKIRLKRRLFIFGIFTITTASALIPAMKLVINRLNESGFNAFFSLLFSDFSIVLNDWQNFFFSLLESFPIMSFVLLLFGLLIFIQALKIFIKNLNLILTYKQYALN